MKWLAAVALLAVSPAWAQTQPDWLPRTTAKLRLLDKVTAQASSLDLKVGQSASYGTLTINLRSCMTRPPDQPADSAAFLAITDTRASGRGFNGWILANTPAVSMFEDPIYDIRLVVCQ